MQALHVKVVDSSAWLARWGTQGWTSSARERMKVNRQARVLVLKELFFPLLRSSKLGYRCQSLEKIR